MDVRFYNVCLVKSIGFISPQISKSLKFGLWHVKSFFPEGMRVVNPYQTSFSIKNLIDCLTCLKLTFDMLE